MTGMLALATAAIFFGAAVYINIAEHPARLKLADEAAVAQWAPAYARGYAMQASLAIVSGLLGLWTWWVTAELPWLLGAAAMLANWPYTLIAIMPVNRRLGSALSSGNFGDVRGPLIRWGHLHAGRSALSATAVILFLAAVR